MYLEINNQNYYLHLQDEAQEIIVMYEKDNTIHLAVPARYTQAELLLYIKSQQQYLQQLLINKASSCEKKLSLFDTSYPIINKPSIKDCFWDSKAIYVPQGIRWTTRRVEELKNEILLREVNKLFSCWEEDLSIMLPPIKLRKFKTNIHYSCRNSNYITIGKHLIDTSYDLFCYIIAECIIQYTNLNHTNVEFLLDKHVKNWRFLRKVLSYEHNTNN